MDPSFESLTGLCVSYLWFGDHTALYLELGELKAGKPRKDGTAGNPLGQITVYAGYDWRIEKTASIYSNKASANDRHQQAAAEVQQSTITYASAVGRLPELEIGFSNGLWLTTFAQNSGQPQWTVSFNTVGKGHLCVARGRLCFDRSDA